MSAKMRGRGKTDRPPTQRLPGFVVGLATFVLVLIIELTRAAEVDSSKKAQEAPDVPQPPQANASDLPAKEANGGTGAAPAQTFDPAVASAGQAAFERSCTTCHDAARALERTKDLAGWRATVRRMAAKRDSDVASEEIEPIAVYLASRNATASGGQGATAAGNTVASAAGNDASSFSTYATLSPMWRGGNDHLQNPGFGPLAFVGGSWQSNIVSARVTVCITCHGVQEPAEISRIDPLEVAVRVDLSQFFDPHVHGMKGGIDA
jgi:hypothetical protein